MIFVLKKYQRQAISQRIEDKHASGLVGWTARAGETVEYAAKCPSIVYITIKTLLHRAAVSSPQTVPLNQIPTHELLWCTMKSILL